MPKTCECGCGAAVSVRFVHGHNRRGAVLSEAHRSMISAANGRRTRSLESREKISGARNPNWRGDDVGYGGLHLWLRRHKVRTGTCEECGETPAPVRGASTGTDFANISGEYRRDVTDFRELCQVCHARFDMASAA